MSIRTTGVRYDVIAKDSASKVFKSVGDGADRLGGRLGKLAKGAAYAGAAIGGAMAAGMVKATSDAVKFEATMKRVQTQAGASAGDVKVLSKQVLELGKTSQQGPQHLAEALYHLKSVGMDNVDAMKALKTSSDLAAVGGADLEDTTNALAGAWRTGIRGATDFGEAASTVNAIIGAGNMQMSDLVAALGTGILPTAKTFGLTFSQVGAALALFTDEGVDSASAATRLRMSISLLAAPSKAAEKQLKTIGLTGNKLGEAMRGPDGIIGAIKLLKAHLDASGLSATKQAALLSHAFGGGKSSSAILSMVNNLDVLEKKQAQVNSSMGKYGPAVAAQRKTAAAQLKIIESNFQVFSIEAGNKLLPPFTKMVTYISTTALPALGGMMGFIQTRMAPVVERFGRTMTDKFIPVGDIKAKTRELTGDMQDFLGALFPKKEPVIPVVPKVVLPKSMPSDLLNYGLPAPTITPKVKLPSSMPQSLLNFGFAPHTISPPQSAAAKAGEQVRTLISGGIGDAIGGIDWAKFGTQIGAGLGKLIKSITIRSADLTKRFSKIIGGFDWVDIGKVVGGQSLGFAIGFMDSMGKELFSVSFWKKHWWDVIIASLSVIGVGKLAGPLGKIFAKIPVLRAAAPFLDKVNRLTKPLGDAASAVMKFFGNSLWKGLAKVFPEGTALLEREAGLITTRLGVWGLDLLRGGGRAMHGLGDGIRAGFEWPIAKLGELIGYLIKPFAKAGGWLVGRGSAIVSGLRSGIASGSVRIGGWVVDHAVTPVRNVFSTAGSWLLGRGSALIGGFKSGVSSGAARIGGWVADHAITPVRSVFSTAGSWLLGRGSALVGGFKSGVSSGAAKIGGWMGSHVATPVRTVFSATGSWLSSAGSSLISGLKSGITTGMSKIGGWLKSSVVDPIVSAVKHWFGIRSPSTVFAGIGGHLVAGLVKGLATSSGLDIARTIFGDLPTALAAIVGKGLVHIEQLPRKALSALQGLGGKAKSLLGSAGSFLAGGDSGASMNSAMRIGQQMLAARGFQGKEWPALRQLWTNESGWRVGATNQSSGAYGIPQALPASKMAAAGPDWRTNPATQIAWGLDYIKARYGTPSVALSAWQGRSPHWYAKGGLAQFGETAWVGERGPELMQVTPRGTRIYNNRDSMAIASSTGMQIPGYAAGTVATGRVSKAQRDVARAEASLTAWRHRETAAHSKAAKRRDQLQVQAAEKRLKAANAELSAAKKLATASNSVSNTLANGFLKGLQTGSAAAIAAAVKSMNTKLQAAGAGSLVAGNLRTASKLEGLANQKASIASKIAAAKQYASDQSSSLGDYLSVGSTSATSVSGLILQMQAGQRTAGRFAAETARLSKAGLSKTLLSQLAAAGPGSQLAATLAGASPSDIRYLNQAAKAQDKLTTSFGRTMADAMYDSGAQAGKGFLTGLMAQEKQLQAEMDKLAAGMVNAIKKRLGIKSPSRVMHEQVGKQVALGAAGGVAAYTPHAVAAVQRMADTMAAIRARTTTATGGRPGPGAGAVAAPQVRVHVHFDDPALRDLIRVEVDQGHVELAEALRAGGA